jgi:hypothetical protein
MLLHLRPRVRSRSPAAALSGNQWERLHRAGNVLFWLTLTGYLAFVVSGISNGVTPGSLVRAIRDQSNYAGDLKRGFESITGITTLTQFGIGYVVVATFSLLARPDRRLRRRLLGGLALVFALGVTRAFLLTERLAILELVIPAATLVAMRFATSASVRKQWAVRLAPLVLIPAVAGMFGAFEYSRSWVYYSNVTTQSFPEFTVSRLAGYYVTAYNNGQISLSYNTYPGRVPYESVQALWTAPIVQELDAYGMVSGRKDPTLSVVDDPPPSTGNLLQQHGNPEFNNPCGLAVPFVDFGVAGGLLFLFVAGCVLGMVYQRFRAGLTSAVLIYPVLATGLFELPRYVYWTQGRVVPSLVALVTVGWWLQRTAQRPSMSLVSESVGRGPARPGPAQSTPPKSTEVAEGRYRDDE